MSDADTSGSPIGWLLNEGTGLIDGSSNDQSTPPNTGTCAPPNPGTYCTGMVGTAVGTGSGVSIPFSSLHDVKAQHSNSL